MCTAGGGVRKCKTKQRHKTYESKTINNHRAGAGQSGYVQFTRSGSVPVGEITASLDLSPPHIRILLHQSYSDARGRRAVFWCRIRCSLLKSALLGRGPRAPVEDTHVGTHHR